MANQKGIKRLSVILVVALLLSLVPATLGFAATTPVDTAKVSAFVSRLYTEALNRPAEAVGLAYWTNQLATKKQTASQAIRWIMLESPEFTGRNLTGGEFVEVSYNTFFNRDADAPGKAYWLGQLTKGYSRNYVIKAMINAPTMEFQNMCKAAGIALGTIATTIADLNITKVEAFVSRLYTDALNRPAEAEGLAYWTNQLATKKQTASQAIRWMMLESPEFTGRSLTDGQFVEVAYKTFFDRDADAPGKTYWLGQLAEGYSRNYVIKAMINAPTMEFQNMCKAAGIALGTIATTIADLPLVVESVSAINSTTVAVTLSSAPATAPVVGDFSVTQSINGATATILTPTLVMNGAVATFTVAPVVATTADQSVVYSVSYKGGAAVVAPAFTVAKVVAAAVISNVSFVSNNVDNTKAMNGDTITLTFTSDKPVTKLGNFKINGSNPTTFTNVGNVYTVTHLVDAGDIVGANATFQINVQNAAGIYSQTIEATTDGSSVGIVAKYALISNVTISSSNADPTKAMIGDTISLRFASDEAVTQLSNFKINGSNPNTFLNNGNMYIVTHIVDAGDVVEGPATFQLNVKNAAGIYSPTIEATTDSSSVSVFAALQTATAAVVKAEGSKLQVDIAAAKLLVNGLPADVAPATTKAGLQARVAAVTAPVISNVSFVSSNANNTKAMNGDTITLTFTSDQAITKSDSFKINGSNPNTFTNVGSVYTVTHLVDGGDTVGANATFQINVQNAKGVYSQTVEATTDSSSVSIIAKYARISNVRTFSNNADPKIAVNGDTVFLTFTSDEIVTQENTFKISGSNPDTFTRNGNTYIVTHLVDSADARGTLTFQINVKNVAGFITPTVENATVGSMVEIQ